MVEKFGDRIKETTDTTGTGTIDLNGAPTGFRAFGDAFTSGDDEISYLIVDDPDNPTDYEVGKGTFTSGSPDTFARDTVEVSSNSGNKVSFQAGTKTVIASPTAADFAKIFRPGSWALKTATVRSITADDSQVAGDDGRLVTGDGSGNSPAGLTFTLLAAATAGDGFLQLLKNAGSSGTMTIDGSGSETINGRTTLELEPGDFALLICDGSGWDGAVYRPGTYGTKDLGSSGGGTITPDFTNGPFQKLSVTGAFTLAEPEGELDGVLVIEATDDGSGYSPTIAAGYDTITGTYDTTASAVNLLKIYRIDGASYLEIATVP